MLLKNEALREWLGWTSSGIIWSASPLPIELWGSFTEMLRQFAKGLRIHPFALLSPSNKMISSFMTPSRITVFSGSIVSQWEESNCCWLHLKGCKQGFYMLLLHLFQCFCFGKVHSLIDLRHVWHSQLLATAQILWSCQSLLESRDECLDKGFTRFPLHSCFLLFSFAIFCLAQVAHQCLGFTTLLLADTHRHVSLLELDKKTFH